jgi:TPR repeat protein
MTPFVRTVAAALVSLLAAACAQERETPEPAVSPSQANINFAMFMNDPTNRDSWRWLCRAAAGGHTAAQYIVGVRYRDGLPPVAQNLPRAFLWFTAARKGGLTAAALAGEDVAKRLPEGEAASLLKDFAPPTEADCREGGK